MNHCNINCEIANTHITTFMYLVCTCLNITLIYNIIFNIIIKFKILVQVK